LGKTENKKQAKTTVITQFFHFGLVYLLCPSGKFIIYSIFVALYKNVKHGQIRTVTLQKHVFRVFILKCIKKIKQCPLKI